VILWMVVIAQVVENEGISIKEGAENAKEETFKVDRVEQQKAYDLEEARQEIKLLKEYIRNEKRHEKERRIRDDKRHKIARMIRNADEADIEQMEEMLNGKIDSISGRKNEATVRRAKDDAFQLLEKKIKKVEKTLTAKMDSQEAKIDSQGAKIDSQGAKIDSQGKKIDSQGAKIESQGKSLTADIDSTEKRLRTKIDSAIANQLRCLSGYQKFKMDGYTYRGRVTFNPAFSGTPDLCFSAFKAPSMFGGSHSSSDEMGDYNVQLLSKNVKSTHVDFEFFQIKGRPIEVQWMACGHSNRGMTAEMLLDLKLNE